MFGERELPLPLCLIDPDLNCPEDFPMLEKALETTLKGDIKANVTIEEYKTQVRNLDPIEKAEIRSINQQIAKGEGVFELCINHEDAKFGIGYDQ